MKKDLSYSPLGKSSSYISSYTKSLLFPISRIEKRLEIGIIDSLPFYGFDTWNAYEVSWLNAKGKPVVAIAQFDIACDSQNIIESKSFKLYLNSFNQTRFHSFSEVKTILERDIQEAVQGAVYVHLYSLNELEGQSISSFSGQCLDELDIDCDTYQTEPRFLSSDAHNRVSETVYSDLLKSNCLVTGQPDWGSVKIDYQGPKINEAGLLHYIVSFRNHNEFHEQCVERIFVDIMRHCGPQQLTVEARYTRRGGLDINPIRSTLKISPARNIRMARQ